MALVTLISNNKLYLINLGGMFWGLGFGVWGLGFGVWGLGFGALEIG
jgi:hypothetical protein